MESEKYICIREDGAQGASLTVVDLTNNNEVSRIPMSAESTIMNPESKMVALRKGTALQVFNLDTKSKVCSFKLPDNNNVVFWCWIDPKTIAIVTQSSVFHWSIEGESNPRKVMDRHPNLAQCQIINYRVSPDQKWCMLVGIGKGAENSVAGTIQLYSVDNKKSQVIAGHCGGFINVDNQTAKGQLFTFIMKEGPKPHCKFQATEIGKAGGFKVKPVEFAFPNEAANDFPVCMEIDDNRALAYVMTKMGYVYMFDIMTGTLLFRSRISPEPIFLTTKVATGGIIGLTSGKGGIIKVTLNEANLVPFVMNGLKMTPLALDLACRLGLPGADDIFMNQFSAMMQQGNIKGAAHVAYKSPKNLIRNENTIRKLQQMPAAPGQQPPFVAYIGAILEQGRLNEIETIEFCKIILQQGKKQIIEKWVKEDKITCSEALGDMVAMQDARLAMAIYFKGKCHEKVVASLVRAQQYEKVLQYCKQNDYHPDYNALIRNMVSQDPKAAEGFAKMLAQTQSDKIDVQAIADTFYTMGLVQECTGFLLEVLQKRGDLPEDAALQTRVLEINLTSGNTQVADAILSNKMFSHFDKEKIAELCERAGLYQAALSLYTDIDAIKRVVVNTHMIKPEFLVQYIGELPPEQAIEVLRTLMSYNSSNVRLVVQVAQKYSEHIGVDALINLFEEFSSTEGLFYFLGAIAYTSTDGNVQLKFIEAATKMGQFKEVERMCREGSAYDPKEVKAFLIDANLPDPLALIHLCNRFDMIEDMTQYLYEQHLTKYIEAFVQKVAPAKTPVIIGKLIDMDASEDFIQSLLNSVMAMCPIAPLVDVCESRNRLRMIQPWLEARLREGSTDPELHNAIGKIYISNNQNAQEFLLKDAYYDSKVIGQFCEKVDPFLAFLAYRRANGACDDDLIRVTNENGLF